MTIARFRPHCLGFCTLAAMLASCSGSQTTSPMLPGSNAPNTVSGGHTFHYTGAEQTFIVPAHVKQITVVARGGAGGGADPGRGGRVYAIIPVTPGEKLFVFVGGAGLTDGTGGFNGGGAGATLGCPKSFSPSCDGGGGGGASDVRRGGDKWKNRILVAAGGGGAGGTGYGSVSGGPGNGGGGGGLTGATGVGHYSGPGTGGTQTSGGEGGKGGPGIYESDDGFPGKDGSRGNGGAGGEPNGYLVTGGGGAGGGGYFGGGGGGGPGGWPAQGYGGAGGGGGSSWAEPSAINFRTWGGWKHATGNGQVVFSWH